jgi:hypothetical protein
LIVLMICVLILILVLMLVLVLLLMRRSKTIAAVLWEKLVSQELSGKINGWMGWTDDRCLGIKLLIKKKDDLPLDGYL